MSTSQGAAKSVDGGSFPYFTNLDEYQEGVAKYYQFKLQGCRPALGYMLQHVAESLPVTPDWSRDEEAKELIFQPRGTPFDPEKAVEHRSKVLAKYLQDVRETQTFKVLGGWRNERYPVYGPGKQLLFSMERSASPLFGIVTYGVHMTAFVRSPEGLKIWAPKRAPTKQTYPGMMDNTVAGGLSVGEKPTECLIREAQEEASLPEDIVASATSCGTMTYFHVRDARAGGEVGLCQPECQYVYDLELPKDVVPRPGDDEAVDFQLLTLKQVQDAMGAGQFKPNCALLLLDFFVRHGILTPENEAEYVQIVSRLHRRLEFPTA